MVRVTMLRKKGVSVGFEAHGHANCGEAGTDIVCSAISALTQTCLIGMQDVLGLKPDVDYGVHVDEVNGVRFLLGGDTREEKRKEAALLLDTMEAGLRSIQDSYRSAIKISHREV